MKFLLKVIINAVAIWLATLVLSGLEVVGGDETAQRVLVFLAVALVFGVVNAIVKPVVKLLSLPLYILTLGLFTVVVNAAMLWLVGWLSEQTDYGLRIDNFWTAVVGALIISVASFVMSLVVRD
ncbi:phage holin family protein [Actinotalea fermentans]|uniref:Membrane protein n=1 Tax=Actinotalea fermentans TaxID=43671 RepID=A0A511Z2A9_9CELL|nr:phage holin family protein [Actinotalea fermentans]KGM14966.1 membrane protein [Actinotalea fermentans ATCC 43279 = JCM 9966 = DSM 3133]GEN81591.1 membrane protein [Actinotalea fermentans]